MKSLRLLLLLVPATLALGQTITTTSLPDGAIGEGYGAQLTCTNCPQPSWTVGSGFPPGLNLGIDTGIIGGSPTAAGTYTFQISLTIPSSPIPATKTLSIIVHPALTITTNSLPNGTLNVPYSQALSATGGVGNYTWYVPTPGGGFPPGLSLVGGVIQGTPTALGTYTFTVGVFDNSQEGPTKTLSMTIVAAPLAITSTSIPVGFQGVAYSTTITGNGGAPPYTWSLGNLSDGLSIDPVSGTISGTPTAAGQYTLNVTVTDSTTTNVTRGFTLNVLAPLTVTTTSLPNGNVGTAYPGATLAATGGQPPYKWSIPITSMPPGLTLNSSLGTISGTPTTTGFYALTATVTDSQNNTASAKLSISVGNGITITPATLPGGTIGVAYSQALTATGGQSPYTWSLPAGALPTGLTLNTSTGTITGTPTAAGTSTFTVQATDAANAIGQTRYSVVIANGPLTVTTTSLPGVTVGNTSYSQTLAASGGKPPYTWSITTGGLPTGMTIAAATGIISGTPTATGTFSFTVQVADAAGAIAQKALSIVVGSALTITTTSLPVGVVGVAYSQTLAATGGTAPLTWSLGAGTLPAGLTLNATGVISGTPTATGTSGFTISVKDAQGQSATGSLSIVVTTLLTATPTTLPAASVGVSYTQTITASGGIAPYTFTLNGTLPAGFTFTAATGTITGTANAAESGNFTIIVKDASGQTVTLPLTLTASVPTPPVVIITGAPATSGFQQQLPITVAIGTGYPLNISGTVTLTFAPSVTPSAGVDDQIIQFSSGGRVINFTIPANSTTPILSGASSITVLTGTTAGTITLTTNLKDSTGKDLGTTTKTIVDNGGVPFISSVSFQQTPGGVTVTVVGFSSTRDMTSGNFTFAPASNVTFTNSTVTVQLASAFTTWWSNTAQSNPFGTQFTLTVPFTTSTQSTSVVSVTVNLTNSKGTSNSVSLSQ